MSAPPTTAASHRPASIMRAALANTLAVDAQADETTRRDPPARTAGDEIRERVGVVGRRDSRIRRAAHRSRVAVAIGHLGAEDPRGAGAQEHAYAMRTVLWRAASTAASKPSWPTPCSASRLLRQSKRRDRRENRHHPRRAPRRHGSPASPSRMCKAQTSRPVRRASRVASRPDPKLLTMHMRLTVSGCNFGCFAIVNKYGRNARSNR